LVPLGRAPGPAFGLYESTDGGTSFSLVFGPSDSLGVTQVGLDPKDMYDPAKSMCLKCHATVVKAPRTLKGVYCETCHGAGSLYFEPHKEKGAYQKGGLFALGMLALEELRKWLVRARPSRARTALMNATQS
jgi:hypothetical protein